MAELAPGPEPSPERTEAAAAPSADATSPSPDPSADLSAPAPDPGPTVEPAAVSPCMLSSGKVTAHPFEGKSRTYILYVSAGASSASRLFVSLHGATGTAEGQAGTIRLPVGSGVSVFPQATGTPPGSIWNAAPGSEDVRFINDLVAKLHVYGCGSASTTSLSGFSLGAMIAARLVCHRPDLYASVAMVAGVLPPVPGCRISPRTSVLVVHGTSDTNVPYDGTLAFWLTVFAGGPEVSAYPGVSRAQMAALWQQAKGCEPGPMVSRETAVREFDLTSCGTAPTRAVISILGNHTWDPPNFPGSTTARIMAILGERGVPGKVVSPSYPAVVKLANGPATMLVNVTVANAGGRGYTTLYPCGTAAPLASTNSYVWGETVSTMALVRTDGSGHVCVRTSAPTHVIVDNYGPAGAVVGHSPVRLMDTRARTASSTGERLPGGGVLRVPSRAPGGSTVFANVTVTGAESNGYTTVFPCDSARPTASTNNFVPGRSSAGFAVVATDAEGNFCVYSSAATHIIVDAYAEATALSAHTAQRLSDTRTLGGPTGGARMVGGSVLRVGTGAQPGSTVFANITVTDAATTGYTTVFPCDAPRPNTSTNNLAPGRTSANGAAVRVDVGGAFCVFSSSVAHVVVDTYAETDVIPLGVPARVFDSRNPW